MILLHQGCATIILVTLTLTLQSVSMVLLIEWIKAQFPGGIHPLSIFRSTLLVLRFTSLLICLHMLEIMLWSSFYRLKCFPTWERAFYFSVVIAAFCLSAEPVEPHMILVDESNRFIGEIHLRQVQGALHAL